MGDAEPENTPRLSLSRSLSLRVCASICVSLSLPPYYGNQPLVYGTRVTEGRTAYRGSIHSGDPYKYRAIIGSACGDRVCRLLIAKGGGTGNC